MKTYNTVEEATAAWPECTHVLKVTGQRSYAPAQFVGDQYRSRDGDETFMIGPAYWEVTLDRRPGPAKPQKPTADILEMWLRDIRQILGLPEGILLDEIKFKIDELTRVVQFPERMEPRNKYDREILPRIHVDVYDVLNAFKTDSPEVDHAVKKLLAPGNRGHKDQLTDLKEAMQSIQRRIDRLTEWSK